MAAEVQVRVSGSAMDSFGCDGLVLDVLNGAFGLAMRLSHMSPPSEAAPFWSRVAAALSTTTVTELKGPVGDSTLTRLNEFTAHSEPAPGSPFKRAFPLGDGGGAGMLYFAAEGGQLLFAEAKGRLFLMGSIRR